MENKENKSELFDKGRTTITEHIQNTFKEGEFGDMQGIIGASLPEIKSLELKTLADETEVIKAEEI